MNKPTTKAWVSKKRVRNHIAKKLLTEPKYRPKRIENKRKDADPKDDYTYVDAWINAS